MLGHSDPQPRWLAALAIASVTTAAALSGCATAGGSTAANTSANHMKLAAVNAPDADMPDDLGKPMGPEETAKPAVKAMSIDMPIASIASKPAGKAVLEHDLPGLCERPEFMMFKGMSLKALAGMSNGRITTAKLNQVQADLVKVSVTADNR